MRPTRAAAVMAATLLVLAGGAGCTGDGGAEPDGEAPTATPTPLSELATETLTVVRGAFCDRVSPEALEDALGGPAGDGDPQEWANGERARVAPGVRDVVHEFGCRWRTADGVRASAWVFAPPVPPGRAAGLRRAAVRAEGCDRVAGAPPFGVRSVAVRCADGSTAFHGLFGDAWLSCSLTLPDGTGDPAGDAALERAERWCAAVVQAAGA